MFDGVLTPPEQWDFYKQPRLFIVVSTNDAGTPAAYAWTQQYQNAAGVFSDDPSGQARTKTDQPAYMADGSAAVPSGTICEAVQHYGGWLIAWPIRSSTTIIAITAATFI